MLRSHIGTSLFGNSTNDLTIKAHEGTRVNTGGKDSVGHVHAPKTVGHDRTQAMELHPPEKLLYVVPNGKGNARLDVIKPFINKEHSFKKNQELMLTMS